MRTCVKWQPQLESHTESARLDGAAETAAQISRLARAVSDHRHKTRPGDQRSGDALCYGLRGSNLAALVRPAKLGDSNVEASS